MADTMDDDDDDCPACGGCGVFDMHVCPCVEDPGRRARIENTLDKLDDKRRQRELQKETR